MLLALTGATSSMAMDGRLETTFTSGTGYNECDDMLGLGSALVRQANVLPHSHIKPLLLSVPKVFLFNHIGTNFKEHRGGATHRLGREVEVGKSVQLQEQSVHKLLDFHVSWVLLFLHLLLDHLHMW